MTAWFAPERVRRHALEAPASAALIDDEGDGTVSWAELDSRVDVAAAALRARSVRPGDRVALGPGRATSIVVAILGILRAGGVAGPLPDGLTARELAAAQAALRPTLTIGPGELVGGAPRGRDRAPAPAEPDDALNGSRRADLDRPAVVVLTSGTEGHPKGVILSARALAISAEAWLAALPPVTGWLLALGLTHVAGLGVVWRAIRDCVPVTVVAPHDPEAQLAALLRPGGPSHVSLVPTQLARLLDAAEAQPPPTTLRAVLLGGGVIPLELVMRAIEAGWPVVPTYGLSEAASGVTAMPTADVPAAPGSAGRPLPGVGVEIADPGADGTGEIVVTSPSGFSGYLDGPARRPEDPIRTGDLGRIDDRGRLFVTDRRLDRIVRGGLNISPAEVESVLTTHPAVREAAVVGRPDPDWGQVPVAAVVLQPGAKDPGDASLVAHARSGLAGPKVPVGWLRLDTLPRTTAGKLQRAPLRALVDGSRRGQLARPGGDRIGWRITGDGPVPILLLPGTLSSADQLQPLADALAHPGDVVVHTIDRRGGGTSRLGRAGPLDIAVHIRDLVAYLDARAIAAVTVGISYGGVLALELAARHPDRALGVAVWEPPYGPLADASTRRRFEALARRTASAYQAHGPAGAAETFLRAVAGDAAWERLSPRSRAAVGAEGLAAVADSALLGLDAEGLARIAVPTIILSGSKSPGFYASIADAVAARVPAARRQTVAGMSHVSPIFEPSRFATVLRSALQEARLPILATSDGQAR